MSKTKFIKVQVSERLPDKEGIIVAIDKKGVLKTSELSSITNMETFNLNYDYWLEEIPDREEEMKDMLKHKIELNIKTARENIEYSTERNMDNAAHSWEGRILAYRECLQLLNKLKQ